MATTWIPETQDFPANTFCDERYEDLVALQWRILLHPADPRTLVDIDNEIRRHVKEGRRMFRNGTRRGLISEWQEHFCTLWEMRNWLKRERNRAVA